MFPRAWRLRGGLGDDVEVPAVLQPLPVETTVPATAGAPSTRSTSRVLAVDVLRGLTVAFMILVNDPGDWSHVFRQLDHAEWTAWTMPDLVSPTFLFLWG